MSNLRGSAYLLTLIVTVAWLTSLVWKPAPPPQYTGIDTATIPTTLGGFVSRGDYQMPPEVKAALSSADIISRTYAGDSGANPIDFVLIGGTDRSALHDPRSCLIGAGQRIENDHVEVLPGTNVQARTCRVLSSTTATPDYDMLYVYVVDGQIVNQVTQIRMQMLWSALLGRKNRPVYFVRFMVPVTRGDEEGAARQHTVCQNFASQMWTALALTKP